MMELRGSGLRVGAAAEGIVQPLKLKALSLRP
jgi:hypothetical protein